MIEKCSSLPLKQFVDKPGGLDIEMCDLVPGDYVRRDKRGSKIEKTFTWPVILYPTESSSLVSSLVSDSF